MGAKSIVAIRARLSPANGRMSRLRKRAGQASCRDDERRGVCHEPCSRAAQARAAASGARGGAGDAGDETRPERRRQVVAHAVDQVDLGGADLCLEIVSGGRRNQRIGDAVDDLRRRADRGSSGARSPSAPIATIWRAVPAGRYARRTEVVKRSRRYSGGEGKPGCRSAHRADVVLDDVVERSADRRGARSSRSAPSASARAGGARRSRSSSASGS